MAKIAISGTALLDYFASPQKNGAPWGSQVKAILLDRSLGGCGTIPSVGPVRLRYEPRLLAAVGNDPERALPLNPLSAWRCATQLAGFLGNPSELTLHSSQIQCGLDRLCHILALTCILVRCVAEAPVLTTLDLMPFQRCRSFCTLWTPWGNIYQCGKGLAPQTPTKEPPPALQQPDDLETLSFISVGK